MGRLEFGGPVYNVVRHLLSQVDQGRFCFVLSVPLVLEYEEVAKRQARSLGLSHSDIDDIIDYLCSIGDHRKIYFLWRPMLRDPHDDLVLELAVEAQVDAIVTYNVRDFGLARTFGLDVLTPQQFLGRLEVKK